MAECRLGGRRGDARGSSRGGGCGDLPNEEVARQRDPLFNDVFRSSDADEPSKNNNSNIFSMPVYDTLVYDEDIISMLGYDKLVYDENIVSMSVYDMPVYSEDILPMPV
ncbi:hypothetical protein SASPL_154244 [Salvia splendens]|uniref:Uncharacterized protein n=1 Tax=Salvia splendens TaxID=180675 RepID=A0A8X8YZ41_SALSN|nr:hypothetical protein SASPL_154244 [Salvia splendens]